MKFYGVKEERNILLTIKSRKSNWFGHILRRTSLLIHIIEGKLEERLEVTRRRGRRRKHILDKLKEKRILETEKGSTRSHPVENSLWKSLWTCRKTDYGMNE